MADWSPSAGDVGAGLLWNAWRAVSFFNRCWRQGSVEGPRLGQKIATQILADVVEEWMKKRSGILLDVKEDGVNQICSFMWTDNFWIMSHSKEILKQMPQYLIEEANGWDLEPEPASLCWTSTKNFRRKKVIWFWAHQRDATNSSFEDKFRKMESVQWTVKGKRAMLWKNDCSKQTRPSVRTLWCTRAKMFRGRLRVNVCWTMRMSCLPLGVKTGRGPSRLDKFKGWETKTMTRLFRLRRQKRRDVGRLPHKNV